VRNAGWGEKGRQGSAASKGAWLGGEEGHSQRGAGSGKVDPPLKKGRGRREI